MPPVSREVNAIYRSLISLSVLLTLLTVILSAYIRLAEVGLGCQEWPDCYARLDVALEKRGITVLTAEGRDMAHHAARVAHRYIASALGLFVLGIFLVALRRGRTRATSLAVPAAVLAITLFLSLLGYYTPTRSNPLITMGNLLGGMAMLGLLWWLMQRESGESVGFPGPRGLRTLAVGALCLVSLQIVLGGWASANYASASCPGLVRCEGGLPPASQIADAFDPLRTVVLDDAGKVVRGDSQAFLTLSHRVFALFTAGYLAWLVRRLRPLASLRGSALSLSLFSIGQIAVGVATIWLGMPLLLLTLHNTLAACLLLASVNLLERLTPSTGSPLPR